MLRAVKVHKLQKLLRKYCCKAPSSCAKTLEALRVMLRDNSVILCLAVTVIDKTLKNPLAKQGFFT